MIELQSDAADESRKEKVTAEGAGPQRQPSGWAHAWLAGESPSAALALAAAVIVLGAWLLGREIYLRRSAAEQAGLERQTATDLLAAEQSKLDAAHREIDRERMRSMAEAEQARRQAEAEHAALLAAIRQTLGEIELENVRRVQTAAYEYRRRTEEDFLAALRESPLVRFAAVKPNEHELERENSSPALFNARRDVQSRLLVELEAARREQVEFIEASDADADTKSIRLVVVDALYRRSTEAVQAAPLEHLKPLLAKTHTVARPTPDAATVDFNPVAPEP